MGLTPLGGVMMGTRTGDLDPAIIPFVIDREPEMADAERIRHVFNKESGLLGISEKSSDMRDIIAGKNAGDENVPWPMIFMWIVCVNTSLNTSVC